MNADGRKRAQVTKENRWFINSPTWTPDGQYVFARKHFAAQRSLGAGEIWMFHSAGGDGLQVTEKNGQKDAGEPAFSPDGRYLYFSQDVTPGRDLRVQQGSLRPDLRDHPARPETGKERTLRLRARAARSAARVARRQVARVRPPRVGSRLFVRDLESGAETGRVRRPRARHAGDLGDPRRLPGYAWTPDGKGLVFWARAGLCASTSRRRPARGSRST